MERDFQVLNFKHACKTNRVCYKDINGTSVLEANIEFKMANTLHNFVPYT